jgi:cytochrome c553
VNWKNHGGNFKVAQLLNLSKSKSYAACIFCFCVVTVALIPFKVQAVCPDIPKVEWWAGFDHQTAIKFVGSKYDGDWGPYINVWRKQHSVLKNLYQRGKTAIVRGRRTIDSKVTRYTIRLKDDRLANYIGKVAERVKVLECLSGAAGGKSSQTNKNAASNLKPNPIQINLEAKINGRKLAFKFGCQKCHGKESIIKFNHIPNLNGQNILYLARQLTEFKTLKKSNEKLDGAQNRHSAFMSFQVKQFDNSDIWDISAYFASNPRCIKSPRKRKFVSTPEIIKNCSSCHGQNGIADFPEAPNLASQNQEYILNQLKLFTTKVAQTNSSNHLVDSRYHLYMSRIMGKMDESELESIASYYAGLPCK